VNALFQLLSDQEIPTLLEMMREFYSQQEMRFDEPTASLTITSVRKNPELAQIYLIFRGTELAGYFVLTFCFSMEFHGRFGLLDELYLHEPFRRQKLGQGVVGLLRASAAGKASLLCGLRLDATTRRLRRCIDNQGLRKTQET
jgi:hypothetical protein